MQLTLLERLGLERPWAREGAIAALALLFGSVILPFLIFLAGAALLGRYEGASAAGIYGSVYRGLGSGSIASWIVVLGPYGLYLMVKGLRVWWRESARLDSQGRPPQSSG